MMKTSRAACRGWFFRILFFLVGQFLSACGIILAVKSDLGVSAGSALPNAFHTVVTEKLGSLRFLYLDFSRLGDCTTLLFWIFVVLQIVLLRERFPLRNLLQIFGSVLIGVFVNAAEGLLGWIAPQNYIQQLCLIVCAILVQGLGIAIYIDGKVMLMPPEGIVMMIHTLCPKVDVGRAKIIEDVSLVGLAVLLSVTVLHRIVGIREGTILLAVAVGPVMGTIHKVVEGPLKALYFPEEREIPIQAPGEETLS